MPGKVLIADDSLKVQKELTQILKGAGVEVVTVSNGEHAVRKLPTVQPDLVLADIFMPVRSGYEVCDFIKSSADFGHVAVLLLASKMEPYDEKEAQRVRADGKLEKPIADAAAALALIQQHLGKAVAAKPAPPPPPIEEFAAAVPAAPEPEPEPEAYATRPAPLKFEAAAPMGFTDVEEVPAAAPPAAPVDLSQATLLSTAADLKKRMEPAPPPPVEEAPPAPVAGFEPPPPAPAAERTKIEKPELAAAWEMTGPPPGAPPIPSGPAWDSQWKGEEGAAAEAPPAEGAAPAEQPYSPEDFAAAFAAAGAEPAPPPVEETPPPVAEAPPPPPPAAEGMRAAVEEAVAAHAPELDPAVVERVVNEVLARLTPQVTETIAREIIRPLTEALLKEQKKP